MKECYITTAIDYANGSPHLGHAYEKILADVMARVARLQGQEVHFLTGLDEHGQKVQQTAERLGIAPQEFCDKVACEFQEMCHLLNISNDDYVRTTQSRHKEVVQKILQKLYDRGEIYFAEYSGFYSPRAEQFVLEKDKVDGKWPEEFGEIIEIKESNYFFKLSQYQDRLVDFLQKNEDFIIPNYRQKQVLEFLKSPINDLCISRPKSRLAWGIELPFDTNYVTYVWFDALINYISVAGYGTPEFSALWPADFHVIGKDILLPAHSVYWPIMLMAIGLPMPKHLLAHGWWLAKGGEKMSKSLGNTINPLEYSKIFGADAFRFFVMREMTIGQDSNFTHELFMSRYQGELANDLGNLVSRLLHMIARYSESKIPEASVSEAPELELQTLWNETLPAVQSHYKTLEFNLALEKLFIFIKALNRYAEIRAPWKLAKCEGISARQELETSLYYMARGLSLAATLLLPVMPTIGRKILELIGLETPERWSHLEWNDRNLAHLQVGEREILFPKIEMES